MRIKKDGKNRVVYILSWCDSNNNFPLFLRDLKCDKCEGNVVGLIACETYVKFEGPFDCRVIKSVKGFETIRVLQRELPCFGEWVVIIDPNCIVPPNFINIIKSECGDPETLYGAEKEDYDTIEEHESGRKSIRVYQENSEIGNGYFQVYCNQSRFPPNDKQYPLNTIKIQRAKKTPPGIFKSRFKSIKSLPMTIDYIKDRSGVV